MIGEITMFNIKSFFKDESGQGMVEYGLIIALVSVALIAGLVALQGGLTNIFTTATDTLNGN
jgi:pilus assembly protein Flp/PilA